MNTLMIPRRQNSLETKDKLPFGMAHPNDTPCPFANDDLPCGYINTCCSFNTEGVVETLRAFGKLGLVKFLTEDLNIDSVLVVAKELRRSADWMESRYEKPILRPDGSHVGGFTNLVTGEFNPRLRSAFEAEVASIRKAADWYEKVGKLGFGVHVWY
jgi:hypothetical protein